MRFLLHVMSVLYMAPCMFGKHRAEAGVTFDRGEWGIRCERCGDLLQRTH